MGKALTELG